MARRAKKAAAGPLPTIWRVDDALWSKAERVLAAVVVERTIGWLNRCRAIIIRYEKKAENYLGAVQLACALLWYRRLHRLTT